MATNYMIRFTQDIKGTKDVKCPSIEVVYTHQFDESNEDKMAHEFFTKNALKRISKVVEKAQKPFKPAIDGAQAKIDQVRSKCNKAKTIEDLEVVQTDLKALETFMSTADILLAKGVQAVEGLINTEIESIEKDAKAYVKRKLKTDLTRKKWVKRLKVVLLGTLTVAAAAAGIAATILTAGTALAAVAAVASIVATAAGAYGTITQSLKDDWENEARTVARIELYFEKLKKMTEDLNGQLGSLEQYQKNRQKKMKEQAKALSETASKAAKLEVMSTEDKKSKKAIAEAVKKSETAMKKLETQDKQITDLLKLGQQTRQFLGPLGSGFSSASSLSSAMKSGANFLVEQTNTGVTIRDNLKNLSGGSKAGSVVIAECSKILKGLG